MTVSRGGLARAKLARIDPDDATMNVITQDAIGCLNVNRRLPAGNREHVEIVTMRSPE